MKSAWPILRACLVAIGVIVALGTVPGGVSRPGLFVATAPPLPPEIGDRDASLSVSVHDDAGHAVEGALVVVLSIVEGRAYEAARAASDSKGEARLVGLPRGESWLLANAEGHARSSSHLVLVGERKLDLVLGPEHAFDVVVRDPDGRPVVGATVEAHAGEPLPIGAATDPNGRAHVGRLAAGPWSVTVRADGYDIATERAKDGDEIAVTLRRLGSILVHVLDIAGSPLRGARVQIAGSALWPAREGKTGEKGMVKLAGLYSGSYALRATRGTEASATELALALGSGENKELELRLVPGRMVTVHVTDGDDDDAEAIAGARIVLTEGGLSPFPLEATSDKKGNAALGPIAPGSAYVSARAEDYVPKSGVLVPEPLMGEVRVGLAKAGTLIGRVTDARGFPVSGATIEVVGTDFAGGPIDDDPKKTEFRDAHFDAVLTGPSPLVPAGELGVLPGPVPPIPRAGDRVLGFAPPRAASLEEPWVTKGDGSFELKPVTPGRVRVLVRHPEYVETTSDVVTLASGATVRDIVVVMGAGGDLEGRVVDSSGKPAAGVRIEITSSRGSFSRTTHAATDGTFAFSSVPDACTLDVYPSDDELHPAARVSLQVPDSGKRDVTITLPAARDPMTVTLKDDRGYAIGAVQLTLSSLDPSVPLRETAFTDEQGEASLAAALGLALRLEARAPGHAPKVLLLDHAPAHVDIALDASVMATGEVRGKRGDVPVATVVLYTDLGPRTAVVAEDGTFSCGDLAPGSARVHITAPGYATLERPTTITAAASGRPTDLGRFELAQEAVVEGRVLDARGDPVQGARVAKDRAPVFLVNGALPPGVAITDSKGRFHLGGLAEETVMLEAYAPDVGTARATVPVSAGRTKTDVTLTLVASGKSNEARTTGGVAITLGETSGDPREVVVVTVVPGSEAERAGLLADDTILTVDGAVVRTIEEARARLNGPVEQDVVVKVRRGAREDALRVPREAVRR